MTTSYKAITTEKGTIPTLYARTLEEIENKVKESTFSYTIEIVERKESNGHRFMKYVKIHNIANNVTNWNKWLEAQS